MAGPRDHGLPEDSAILAALRGAPPEGCSLEDLAERLGVETGRHRFLREALLALTRAGEAVRLGRRYGLPPSGSGAEPGTRASGLIRVVQSGRGFVSFGDEALDEVQVQPEDGGGAIDGDTVELESWEGHRRREGRVTAVLARGRSQLTGQLDLARRQIVPDDPRLPREAEVIDLGPAGRRDDGACVLARIVEYPPRRVAPLGVAVLRVLGEPGKLGTEVARAVAGHGIEEEFPLEVRREAEAVPARVSEEELASRRDLRALHFVTIDPKTARDFDDAIAIEPDAGGGIRVWVAVADVSAYVEEGSPIDREARRRGCSLYLPDRAIPMLPPALSSGICSLRPGEDRLAVAVRLDLGPAGEPRGEEIVAAVIHSRGQLDYGSVAAVLEGRVRGKLEAYREHLLELEELARVAALLRQRRLARGSLDLDLPEAEVALDEDDPERVRTISESRADAPLRRAYNLVEELMLAANEAVGRFFERAGAPTIWRVHAPPTRDALDRLAARLGAYGVSASADALRMERVMARLLRELATHRAARPLSYLVLRALKQAVYSISNLGHYGLASAAYLHFTSPIRRYPDLHVHRLVKELLRERGAPAGRALRPTSQGGATALSAIARESTAAERQAIEVEREVQSLYAAQLMRDQIGLEAWGTVSGVTGFGFFVTLDEPYVDGLVKLERLGGWYELAEEEPRLYLREERAGAARPAILRVISLGDRIKVRVVEASIARRQIDLVPVAEPGSHLPDPSLPEKRRDPRGRREERRGGRPTSARRGRPGPRGDRRGRGKGRSR